MTDVQQSRLTASMSGMLLIAVALILGWPLLGVTAHAEPGKPIKSLQLDLRPKKEVYQIGEPIVVQRELKNIGENLIVLCLATGVHITYTQVAPQRREPRMLAGDIAWFPSCPGQLIEIPAGSSYRDEISLGEAGDSLLKEPGSWEIVQEESFAYGGQKSGIEASTGILTSNPVVVDIEATESMR